MLVNLVVEPDGRVLIAADPKAVQAVVAPDPDVILIVMECGEKFQFKRTPVLNIATVVAEINKHLP